MWKGILWINLDNNKIGYTDDIAKMVPNGSQKFATL